MIVVILIAVESKTYKGRAIPAGTKNLIFIPSASGFQLFQKEVFEVVNKKTEDDIKKNKEAITIYNNALADLKNQIENFNN